MCVVSSTAEPYASGPACASELADWSMNILHVISSLDPASGGPPRVACRLAAAQACLGHAVHIVTYESPGAMGAIAEMTAGLPSFKKVQITYIPGGDRGAERFLAGRAAETLGSLMDDCQVVHLHNFWESIVRVGAREAWRRRKPYFVQPNGMLDPWSLSQKALKKKLAMALGYRRLLNRANGLLLGNEVERRLLQPLGLPTRQFVVPLNGIFPEEVGAMPPQGSFHARYPQLRGRPFILFLGRFHYKKGVDYLADAYGAFASRNAGVQLVMVGYDDGAQADFEQRIHRHGVSDRVHILGPMHGAAKWEAFRDAACFTLPSHQEGFSIAITEALACGLPVVITKGCHFDEVAEAGAGEVVDLETAQLAAAFGRVLDDEARRRQMGQAARQLVASRFNCYRMGELALEAYRQALEGPAPATQADLARSGRV